MEWLKQRFELSRGGGEGNLRPMEGLRGFAVFLVFLVHYVTLVRPWIPPASALAAFSKGLHTVGNSGVDLFFVLSGYLIYGSLLARPQPFFRFMSRRIERIYPAFVTVFCIYVLLSLLFPSENKLPSAGDATAIYLIQNILLLPGLFPIEPMITVAWSLSYEMFYYLTVPLVITVLGLRRRTVILRAMLFSTLAAATAIYCAVNEGPVRLIMFVAGILLCETIDNRHIPTPPSLIGLLALVFGLLATLLPVPGPGGFTLKICLLFASFLILCLACFRDPFGWLARVFSWTPLRWLGNMSYSYYLLHGLALKACFLALAVVLPVTDCRPWFFWALLPAMFSLTIIPTAILFLTVERPFSLVPRRARGDPTHSSPQAQHSNKPAAPQSAHRAP